MKCTHNERKKKMKRYVLAGLLLGTVLSTAYSQKVEWNTPGAGNPFIPGYFADPTVKKFGDTYYGCLL